MPNSFISVGKTGITRPIPKNAMKKINLTYKRLFSEMERLNLALGDYIFEEYIYDTVVMNHKEHFVTKIMVQADQK
ncbi:hypothetical protein GCM10009865_05650 [Aeromicrobium ponti]